MIAITTEIDWEDLLYRLRYYDHMDTDGRYPDLYESWFERPWREQFIGGYRNVRFWTESEDADLDDY